MDYNYHEFDSNEQTTSYGRYEAYPGSYHNNNGDNDDENKKPKKSRSLLKRLGVLMVMGLFMGASFGAGVYVSKNISSMNEEKEVAVTIAAEDEKVGIEEMSAKGGKKIEDKKNHLSIANTTEDMGSIKVNPTDVSDVVEHVMPAIVSINNVFDSEGNFFGQRYSQKDGGSGSGIIIGQNKEEILIVTNNHVSAIKEGGKNQKLTVTFHDETTAESTVKGADSGSDLAVISVKVKDISKDTLKDIRIATLGNSDKMKVGQMVIAIGNALGYGQSTTVGYVSALNREVVGEDYTMKLLQTDAAINPGNSGGALLNTKGEVIGINSIKYASSKIEGMGFAIPITTAIPIINDLMNREVIKESEQSYLGIMGQDVTENHKQIYGMPVGVYVAKVTKNSPAEKNGIKMGNIITGFNGYKIRTMKELQDKLAGVRAGKKVKLTLQIYQSGEYVEKEMEVALGYRSEMKESFKEEEKNTEKRNDKRDDKKNQRRFFEGPEEGKNFFGDEDDFFDFFFNP